MKKLIFSALFLAVSCISALFAQTAASSAPVASGVPDSSATPIPQVEQKLMVPEMETETVDLTGGRVLSLPDSITKLLEAKKIKEAFAAFAQYKSTLTDKSGATLLDLEINMNGYASQFDASYDKTRRELVQKIKEKFPNDPVAINYELPDANPTPQDIVAVSTKMIKADSTYLEAYRMRALALYELKQMEACCRDLSKLPQSAQSFQPGYSDCEALKNK